MFQYDYLVIGSGLYGAVFAREMVNAGKRCLVIDKRDHTGGNIHCEDIEGIHVHKYGPHIFHTNDQSIWEYVNSFVKFNHFIYSPLANYQGDLYNLPFNMNTFYQLWKVKSPAEAENVIRNQVKKSKIEHPRNLEEQAISMTGTDIYNYFIKGYTEKQWGRKASDLPRFLIKRLPLRFNYDNNYFNDTYQGIPIGGYNKLTESLLQGIEVKTGIDFFKHQSPFRAMAKKLVYTGKIDEFYDYYFGHLEYRSLRFEHELLNIPNYQGVAAVNYTDKEIPFTRIVEHKHFQFGNQPNTVITREYPEEWSPCKEPFYPVNDDKNNKKLKQYQELAALDGRVIFGGRLAEYKYYDMHQVIASALKKTRSLIKSDLVYG